MHQYNAMCDNEYILHAKQSIGIQNSINRLLKAKTIAELASLCKSFKCWVWESAELVCWNPVLDLFASILKKYIEISNLQVEKQDNQLSIDYFIIESMNKIYFSELTTMRIYDILCTMQLIVENSTGKHAFGHTDTLILLVNSFYVDIVEKALIILISLAYSNYSCINDVDYTWLIPLETVVCQMCIHPSNYIMPKSSLAVDKVLEYYNYAVYEDFNNWNILLPVLNKHSNDANVFDEKLANENFTKYYDCIKTQNDEININFYRNVYDKNYKPGTNIDYEYFYYRHKFRILINQQLESRRKIADIEILGLLWVTTVNSNKIISMFDENPLLLLIPVTYLRLNNYIKTSTFALSIDYFAQAMREGLCNKEITQQLDLSSNNCLLISLIRAYIMDPSLYPNMNQKYNNKMLEITDEASVENYFKNITNAMLYSFDSFEKHKKKKHKGDQSIKCDIKVTPFEDFITISNISRNFDKLQYCNFIKKINDHSDIIAGILDLYHSGLQLDSRKLGHPSIVQAIISVLCMSDYRYVQCAIPTLAALVSYFDESTDKSKAKEYKLLKLLNCRFEYEFIYLSKSYEIFIENNMIINVHNYTLSTWTKNLLDVTDKFVVVSPDIAYKLQQDNFIPISWQSENVDNNRNILEWVVLEDNFSHKYLASSLIRELFVFLWFENYGVNTSSAKLYVTLYADKFALILKNSDIYSSTLIMNMLSSIYDVMNEDLSIVSHLVNNEFIDALLLFIKNNNFVDNYEYINTVLKIIQKMLEVKEGIKYITVNCIDTIIEFTKYIQYVYLINYTTITDFVNTYATIIKEIDAYIFDEGSNNTNSLNFRDMFTTKLCELINNIYNSISLKEAWQLKFSKINDDTSDYPTIDTGRNIEEDYKLIGIDSLHYLLFLSLTVYQQVPDCFKQQVCYSIFSISQQFLNTVNIPVLCFGGNRIISSPIFDHSYIEMASTFFNYIYDRLYKDTITTKIKIKNLDLCKHVLTKAVSLSNKISQNIGYYKGIKLDVNLTSEAILLIDLNTENCNCFSINSIDDKLNNRTNSKVDKHPRLWDKFQDCRQTTLQNCFYILNQYIVYLSLLIPLNIIADGTSGYYNRVYNFLSVINKSSAIIPILLEKLYDSVPIGPQSVTWPLLVCLHNSISKPDVLIDSTIKKNKLLAQNKYLHQSDWLGHEEYSHFAKRIGENIELNNFFFSTICQHAYNVGNPAANGNVRYNSCLLTTPIYDNELNHSISIDMFKLVKDSSTNITNKICPPLSSAAWKNSIIVYIKTIKLALRTINLSAKINTNNNLELNYRADIYAVMLNVLDILVYNINKYYHLYKDCDIPRFRLKYIQLIFEFIDIIISSYIIDTNSIKMLTIYIDHLVKCDAMSIIYSFFYQVNQDFISILYLIANKGFITCSYNATGRLNCSTQCLNSLNKEQILIYYGMLNYLVNCEISFVLSLTDIEAWIPVRVPGGTTISRKQLIKKIINLNAGLVLNYLSFLNPECVYIFKLEIQKEIIIKILCQLALYSNHEIKVSLNAIKFDFYADKTVIKNDKRLTEQQKCELRQIKQLYKNRKLVIKANNFSKFCNSEHQNLANYYLNQLYDYSDLNTTYLFIEVFTELCNKLQDIEFTKKVTNSIISLFNILINDIDDNCLCIDYHLFEVICTDENFLRCLLFSNINRDKIKLEQQLSDISVIDHANFEQTINSYKNLTMIYKKKNYNIEVLLSYIIDYLVGCKYQYISNDIAKIQLNILKLVYYSTEQHQYIRKNRRISSYTKAYISLSDAFCDHDINYMIKNAIPYDNYNCQHIHNEYNKCYVAGTLKVCSVSDLLIRLLVFLHTFDISENLLDISFKVNNQEFISNTYYLTCLVRIAKSISYIDYSHSNICLYFKVVLYYAYTNQEFKKLLIEQNILHTILLMPITAINHTVLDSKKQTMVLEYINILIYILIMDYNHFVRLLYIAICNSDIKLLTLYRQRNKGIMFKELLNSLAKKISYKNVWTLQPLDEKSMQNTKIKELIFGNTQLLNSSDHQDMYNITKSPKLIYNVLNTLINLSTVFILVEKNFCIKVNGCHNSIYYKKQNTKVLLPRWTNYGGNDFKINKHNNIIQNIYPFCLRASDINTLIYHIIISYPTVITSLHKKLIANNIEDGEQLDLIPISRTTKNSNSTYKQNNSLILHEIIQSNTSNNISLLDLISSQQFSRILEHNEEISLYAKYVKYVVNGYSHLIVKTSDIYLLNNIISTDYNYSLSLHLKNFGVLQEYAETSNYYNKISKKFSRYASEFMQTATIISVIISRNSDLDKRFVNDILSYRNNIVEGDSELNLIKNSFVALIFILIVTHKPAMITLTPLHNQTQYDSKSKSALEQKQKPGYPLTGKEISQIIELVNFICNISKRINTADRMILVELSTRIYIKILSKSSKTIYDNRNLTSDKYIKKSLFDDSSNLPRRYQDENSDEYEDNIDSQSYGSSIVELDECDTLPINNSQVVATIANNIYGSSINVEAYMHDDDLTNSDSNDDNILSDEFIHIDDLSSDNLSDLISVESFRNSDSAISLYEDDLTSDEQDLILDEDFEAYESSSDVLELISLGDNQTNNDIGEGILTLRQSKLKHTPCCSGLVTIQEFAYNHEMTKNASSKSNYMITPEIECIIQTLYEFDKNSTTLTVDAETKSKLNIFNILFNGVNILTDEFVFSSPKNVDFTAFSLKTFRRPDYTARQLSCNLLLSDILYPIHNESCSLMEMSDYGQLFKNKKSMHFLSNIFYNQYSQEEDDYKSLKSDIIKTMNIISTVQLQAQQVSIDKILSKLKKRDLYKSGKMLLDYACYLLYITPNQFCDIFKIDLSDETKSLLKQIENGLKHVNEDAITKLENYKLENFDRLRLKLFDKFTNYRGCILIYDYYEKSTIITSEVMNALLLKNKILKDLIIPIHKNQTDFELLFPYGSYIGKTADNKTVLMCNKNIASLIDTDNFASLAMVLDNKLTESISIFKGLVHPSIASEIMNDLITLLTENNIDFIKTNIFNNYAYNLCQISDPALQVYITKIYNITFNHIIDKLSIGNFAADIIANLLNHNSIYYTNNYKILKHLYKYASITNENNFKLFTIEKTIDMLSSSVVYSVNSTYFVNTKLADININEACKNIYNSTYKDYFVVRLKHHISRLFGDIDNEIQILINNIEYPGFIESIDAMEKFKKCYSLIYNLSEILLDDSVPNFGYIPQTLLKKRMNHNPSAEMDFANNEKNNISISNADDHNSNDDEAEENVESIRLITNVVNGFLSEIEKEYNIWKSLDKLLEAIEKHFKFTSLISDIANTNVSTAARVPKRYLKQSQITKEEDQGIKIEKTNDKFSITNLPLFINSIIPLIEAYIYRISIKLLVQYKLNYIIPSILNSDIIADCWGPAIPREVSNVLLGKKDVFKSTNQSEIAPNIYFHCALKGLEITCKQDDKSRIDAYQELYNFTEKHATLINMIIRQQPALLISSFNILLFIANGLISFDNKRSYFRLRIKQLKDASPNSVNKLIINRNNILADTFNQIKVKKDLISNFTIEFVGEEGVDAGGLTREFFRLLSLQIFNIDYGYFMRTGEKGNAYYPNSLSYINPNHLEEFKYIGMLTAKCLLDGYYFDAHFSRPLYKIIIGKKLLPSDAQFIDEHYYNSVQQLLSHSINGLGIEQYFEAEIDEFGVHKTIELIPNGSKILVTDENKVDYVNFLCQFKCLYGVQDQVKSFMKGFNTIISHSLISIFNEMELELLICGLPEIDLDDLQQHTNYSNYTDKDIQIQMFWEILKTFDSNHIAIFLQFVTGTSKVPLGGFKNLLGTHGIQYFTIAKVEDTDRLPSAHTCYNQLDLPAYDNKEIMRKKLLLAISEGRDGFGFI